jgi:hypothetical protein
MTKSEKIIRLWAEEFTGGWDDTYNMSIEELESFLIKNIKECGSLHLARLLYLTSILES